MIKVGDQVVFYRNTETHNRHNMTTKMKQCLDEKIVLTVDAVRRHNHYENEAVYCKSPNSKRSLCYYIGDLKLARAGTEDEQFLSNLFEGE